MDFSSRYKKRTIQFQSSENSRAVRAVKYAEKRKSKRGDMVSQRRQMDFSNAEDSIIDVSQRDDKENREVAPVFKTKKTMEELAEERYQKLLKWRDEKRKIMELEKRKKKPAFKTGLYHPDNPKYLVSDTEKILSESRLNLTRTPSKCGSATKATKVWHNVSSTAGTPSQFQMKPVLRFRTGVTPSVGTVKPKVVRGLITPQNETCAPLRASSRLKSKSNKETPARLTGYKKKRISNVIMGKEPVRGRNRYKKENRYMDTSSFMSFAPENFIFEAPKGLDAVTSAEFGSKSSNTNLKESKILKPAYESQTECEDEIFYPAIDFCLNEVRAPEVNLTNMTKFFSSRNQDQLGDEADQGIGTEECSNSDGLLLGDQGKENDCMDSNAEKEEENVSLEDTDIDGTEECIDAEENFKVECIKENGKDSGVESTTDVPISGTDTNDSPPKENLTHSSEKKGSPEAVTSPVASKLSWKNTTPKPSPSLEESRDVDEELTSLLLKGPNCHHEHMEIVESPVRPRTRRSFAIAQQVLTPNQPIRIQTPCSRKTRRSLVAHSDLSPASLVYTPDTKPGRRRSVRRSFMTPQENSGSSPNSDDTKENTPNEEPTPSSRRKGKGRRSSRRSFLREVQIESVDDQKRNIAAKKPGEAAITEISAEDNGLQTPQETQRKEPVPWIIIDSPFVTATRGSSSKKNDMKGLFDDIPTDGSPLPAYLTPVLGQPSPSTDSQSESNAYKTPAQDPMCTNLLALLEPSSPKDVTESENPADTPDLGTPSLPKWKGHKERHSVTFNVEEHKSTASFKFPVTPVHSSIRKSTAKSRARVSLLPGLPSDSPVVASDSVNDEPPTMKFFSLDTPMKDDSSSD